MAQVPSNVWPRETSPMRARAIRPEDLPRIAELVLPAFPELELDDGYLGANLFEDPDFEPELCAGCFDGNEPVGIVAAVPRRRGAGAGPVGHLKIIHARSGPHFGEILSGLLERAETELVRQGAERVQTGGAAPVYLLPGLPARSRGVRAILEERGYRCVERRRSMTVDLPEAELDTGEAEADLGRAGIVIRRGGEYDRRVIPAQIGSVFSREWAFEVDRALEDTSRARTRGGVAHFALSGRDLAGFAVAGLWAANAFGPMGTLPGFAGRGIGAVLLKRALGELRSRGISTGLIPWIGPEQFYRRVVNARATLDYRLLEKPLARTES